jgi:saccharopine dehydrogenase (NAD+, L-glutamate forming)
MPKASRRYDLVLFGATGFTGGLTADYLAQHAPTDFRWALAGRSIEKLTAVRQRLIGLNAACADLPLIAADVADAAALKKLAASTRVVATTVGPYLLHGEPLVAACSAAGTDYLDLTGEPEFVDRMWLRYHAEAERSGARIVHCCGFDSIPHDLGVWYTVQQLPPKAAITVEGFVRAGGSFSGGTYHSAITAMSRLRESQAIARQRRSEDVRPPGRRIGSTRERIKRVNVGNRSFWAVPMPTIDPQIVRRSAAADPSYGPEFRYGHYVLLKSLPRVGALIGGVAGLLLGSQLKPTRDWLLRRKSPGDGPSEEARARAWFKVRFVAEARYAKGIEHIVTEVSGGDPGYGETSRMLAEAALCLACDELPERAGMLTPAQAMAPALLTRLQAIGIQFSTLEKE